MIANHIHHALAQVQELQQKILEKQRFKGYSGRARAISGTLALATAVLLSSHYIPRDPVAHLTVWGSLFFISMVLNFGALLYWFLFDSKPRRDIRRLTPVLDMLFPMFVAGIFTLHFILHRQFEYLFGIWMCFAGLANLASRQVLPKRIWMVGLFYILCGSIYLFAPRTSFLQPWLMGIVFFIGEWAGGIILHFDGSEKVSFLEFIQGRNRRSYRVQI